MRKPKKTSVAPYRSEDYLDSLEAVRVYLNEAMDTGDVDMVKAAIVVAGKAVRKMAIDPDNPPMTKAELARLRPVSKAKRKRWASRRSS